MRTENVVAVFSYEITENILRASTERALVRQNVDVEGRLTSDEQEAINSLFSDANEKAAYVANLKRQKGEHFTQLLSASDLGVEIALPIQPNESDAADIAAKTLAYSQAVTSATANVPKKGLATIVSMTIVELLEGTPFAFGKAENGTPVSITGVRDGDTGRSYTSRYRVLSGWRANEPEIIETTRIALVNGLLRDIADGSARIGANDKEEAAYLRTLE